MHQQDRRKIEFHYVLTENELRLNTLPNTMHSLASSNCDLYKAYGGWHDVIHNLEYYQETVAGNRNRCNRFLFG
jgi:hypothetical protein